MSDEPEKTRLQKEVALSDPTAAIWPIIRLVVISVVALVAFHVFYANGFSPTKDGATLAALLTAIGGVDTVKRFIATGAVAAAPKQE